MEQKQEQAAKRGRGPEINTTAVGLGLVSDVLQTCTNPGSTGRLVARSAVEGAKKEPLSCECTGDGDRGTTKRPVVLLHEVATQFRRAIGSKEGILD